MYSQDQSFKGAGDTKSEHVRIDRGGPATASACHCSALAVQSRCHGAGFRLRPRGKAFRRLISPLCSRYTARIGASYFVCFAKLPSILHFRRYIEQLKILYLYLCEWIELDTPACRTQLSVASYTWHVDLSASTTRSICVQI